MAFLVFMPLSAPIKLFTPKVKKKRGRIKKNRRGLFLGFLKGFNCFIPLIILLIEPRNLIYPLLAGFRVEDWKNGP
jgi:hypothetical protein